MSDTELVATTKKKLEDIHRLTNLVRQLPTDKCIEALRLLTDILKNDNEKGMEEGTELVQILDDARKQRLRVQVYRNALYEIIGACMNSEEIMEKIGGYVLTLQRFEEENQAPKMDQSQARLEFEELVATATAELPESLRKK